MKRPDVKYMDKELVRQHELVYIDKFYEFRDYLDKKHDPIEIFNRKTPYSRAMEEIIGWNDFKKEVCEYAKKMVDEGRWIYGGRDERRSDTFFMIRKRQKGKGFSESKKSEKSE